MEKKKKYFLLFISSSDQWTFIRVFVMQPSKQVTCENKSTHTYSSTVKIEDKQPWKVITPAQRIISRQVEVFSSSQDSCCLKTMTTSLMKACEPSQEKLKAAVKFLTLLWALISPWGISILFYKGKWAAGFFFTIGADLLVLELLRWRHLDTLQLLSSRRKPISFCNKILPTVTLKV